MKNNQIINGKEFDRNTGLGGSDATRIYEGDWHQLWSEKTGKSQYPDLSDVLPVQMGIHTEPFNIQWFEKQSEMKVRGNNEHFVHKDYEHLYSHPDGIIDSVNALLECKHTNAFSNAKKIADKYKAQLQHNMMVCNYNKLYISAFFGNLKYEVIEVDEDKEFQEQLLSAELVFWHYVQADKEPPEYIDFSNFNKKEWHEGRTIIPILSRS